jgi:hypothetical protein
MDLLEEIDIADPPLAPVGGNAVLDDVDGKRDEATGGDDDDEVVEVDVGKEDKKGRQLQHDRRCKFVPVLGGRGDGCIVRHGSNREAVLTTH